jgi:hypothetical protein
MKDYLKADIRPSRHISFARADAKQRKRARR